MASAREKQPEPTSGAQGDPASGEARFPGRLLKRLAIPRLSQQAQLAVVFGVAIACGTMASVAAVRFLRGQAQAIRERAAAMTPAPPATIPVVVARQELAPGAVLERSALRLVEWPAGGEPRGSVSRLDELVGRRIKTKVFPGEAVVEMRLVPRGEQGGLQVRIPEGMRAVSLKVDPEIGVSGFITPGSRVDVLATMSVDRDERLTKVVLQHIQVLAVGQEIEYEDDQPTDATTVTLAVSPEEAEQLALARSEGKVMLALRNLQDSHIAETPGFSLLELTKLRPLHQEQESLPEPLQERSAGSHQEPMVESTPHETTAEGKPAAAEPEEPTPPPPPRYHVVELIEGKTISEAKFQIP
jgi:pilus assembly protein CpaB